VLDAVPVPGTLTLSSAVSAWQPRPEVNLKKMFHARTHAARRASTGRIQIQARRQTGVAVGLEPDPLTQSF
jgi:hypothetical protein